MTTNAPTETKPANGSATGAAKQTTAMVPASAHEGGAIHAFSSASNFESAQRMAKALAASTLVPKAYQNNLPNVLIAMELASRIRASVFAVMQNLDIIHGRPSWRALFLIATVNSSGRFTPIRYKFEGKPNTDAWGCVAVAKDRESGEELEGPLVTIALAKAEGWYSKEGSKWKTIPQLMLMYRSAGWWARVYCPELSLGMQTDQEVIDTTGVEVRDLPPQLAPGSAKALEAQLMGEEKAMAQAAEKWDETTGEVLAQEEPGSDG